MRKRYHRIASQCANTKIPEGITGELRRRISEIRQSPKGDYLKTEIFSKYVSPDTDPAETRRTRAINKWLATERENEATNDRLILTPPDHELIKGVPFGVFVSYCQHLVEKVIGATYPVEALIGSFSGGASTSRPRTESYPASKYLGKADVTASCHELFLAHAEEMPGWLADRDILSNVRIVPGNVMFTVPKKTEIDRCACKEPDRNMFIQKGVGNYFRNCLTRIGINLRDQSKNRSLARSGSYTGELATLDLSSASDSVTTELVALMLPVCWYTLLDSARSPVTIIDGEEHRNHMFSSMGNGFTFELESLLFYVLCKAVCHFRKPSGIVSVYGDDIICPTAVVSDTISVLEYFGFQVNPDKSHYTGGFRESCGGHYLNGLDITPFYVKAPLAVLTDVIDVANKLRRWAEEEGHTILNAEPEIWSLWSWLRDLVPSQFWGGEDTSFKYRLVSPHIGRCRLSERTRLSPNGDGGYFHWLNATWDRKILREGVQTSERSSNLQKFDVKKIRKPTVARLSTLFYEEVLTPSMSDL